VKCPKCKKEMYKAGKCGIKCWVCDECQYLWTDALLKIYSEDECN